MLFTPVIELARSAREVSDLIQLASQAGPTIDVLTGCHIVCRPTEKEARDYAAQFMGDMVDNEAVDQLIRLQFDHAQSLPHDALALIRDRDRQRKRLNSSH